jgi:hypothetical protein
MAAESAVAAMAAEAAMTTAAVAGKAAMTAEAAVTTAAVTTAAMTAAAMTGCLPRRGRPEKSRPSKDQNSTQVDRLVIHRIPPFVPISCCINSESRESKRSAKRVGQRSGLRGKAENGGILPPGITQAAGMLGRFPVKRTTWLPAPFCAWSRAAILIPLACSHVVATMARQPAHEGDEG